MAAKPLVPLVVALVLAAACDRTPRVDFSDPATVAASLQRVNEELTPEEQARFVDAVETISADVAGGVPLLKRTPAMNEAIRKRIDGHTVAQLVAMADEIRSRPGEVGGASPAPAP